MSTHQDAPQVPHRAPPVSGVSAQAGRLDRLVADLAGLSRRQATRVIEAGGVLVDERRCRIPGERLDAGVALEIWPDAEAPDAAVDVVWQSDALWVIDKPAGVPTEVGRGGGDSLCGRIGQVFDVPTPHASHRLDLRASGLLAVARTKDARRALDAALRARQIERGYLALVRTWRKPEAHVIEEPLALDDGHASVAPWGLPARTRVVPLAFDAAAGVALVGLRLGTGRTHQARAHLAEAVGAILGDRRYGDLDRTAPRVALHAAWLAWPSLSTLGSADLSREPSADFWALASAELPLPEDWVERLRQADPRQSV